MFSIQKLAYSLIVICLVFYLLIIGKNILVPLVFAAFFAFLLKSLCQRVENFIPWRGLAIFISLCLALLPLIGLVMLFSIQFADIFQNLSSIEDKIKIGIDSLMNEVNALLGFKTGEAEDMIAENSASMIEKPLGYLATTVSVSSNLLLHIFLTFIYTFLLLLYRSSLKKFYLFQFAEEGRANAQKVLNKIQQVIQNYLYGLLIVIGILGTLNTCGLSLIGIDYALFWGFLAALLAVIPYLGTIIGGLLPFLFALASTGTYWQPLLVIGWFGLVQVIEGNIITPKIIGSTVKVNPLAAILALLIGAGLWGVAGMILSLPLIAIIRIIFQQIDVLKPYGLLLSDELYEKKDVFEDKYDKQRFRLSHFFKKRNI